MVQVRCFALFNGRLDVRGHVHQAGPSMTGMQDGDLACRIGKFESVVQRWMRSLVAQLVELRSIPALPHVSGETRLMPKFKIKIRRRPVRMLATGTLAQIVDRALAEFGKFVPNSIVVSAGSLLIGTAHHPSGGKKARHRGLDPSSRN